MDIVVERGAGLDVHKESVVGCIDGSGIKKEVQTFGTMTNELIRLKGWLKDNKITHVAMESTGVYWKPVFNVLEEDFEVILVNARHIKNVPGRKTDVLDSEWLCKLLRCGLVRGSFIPMREIREMRDLTRYRGKLVNVIDAEKNRVQKVLEDANIKISSVATDTFGVSGSAIIDALIKGEKTIEEMTALVKGRLCKKKKEMQEALVGYFREHHKFMIKASLEHIKQVEKIIAELDVRIDTIIEEKYAEEYKLLQTVPGIKEHGAATILAEIGNDMNQFPSEEHLSSWAGLSPGNNESAGKKKVEGQPTGTNA